eukprot:TRINITY_DN2424_c0_g1_i3.p1 TRINITY_DN2424_c0_g1~~TRINITY_DN2424_c0_g1_i3.p1  ORF type:complete len:106 (-),score=14.77 TRINITY_DN2424_c0_g1_i3:341-658(-)
MRAEGIVLNLLGRLRQAVAKIELSETNEHYQKDFTSWAQSLDWFNKTSNVITFNTKKEASDFIETRIIEENRKVESIADNLINEIAKEVAKEKVCRFLVIFLFFF